MNTININNISDTPLWDIWMSMYHLAAVSVADELGIFNCLTQKNLGTEEIAIKLNLSTRAVQILIEVLVGLKFIIKKNKKYFLSPTAKTYLLPDSLFYWGAILFNLRAHHEHQKILAAIKKGSNQLLFENKTFSDMWKEDTLTQEAAAIFTQKMHATIFAPAAHAVNKGIFKATKNLLDVGGGSGCFNIAYALKYPKYKALVFDLLPVCDVAKTYIQQFKVANRVSVHPGNFFIKNNWPHGRDGILLSQILHDWPIDHCKKILKYAYDCLPKGGIIYIHEMLLDKDRISPLTTVCFDLLMFINHHSQQFTQKEIFDLLKNSGFNKIKIQKTFGYYSIISAQK